MSASEALCSFDFSIAQLRMVYVAETEDQAELCGEVLREVLSMRGVNTSFPAAGTS